MASGSASVAKSLFESHGKTLPHAVAGAASRVREAGQTALIVVVDGDGPPAGGVIAVSDQPRPDAAAALAALKRSGVAQILILTGDHKRIAQAVAETGRRGRCSGRPPAQREGAWNCSD